MILRFRKEDMPKAIATVAGFCQSCEAGKEYILEIKEVKKKRSLDANAYYWVLINKIAEKTGVHVTDVYRQHIREIGGNNDLLCIQTAAADAFCSVWESRGIGWIAEQMPSKIAGCVNVLVYYGSSTYDTAQMSRLIESAIGDCAEWGIEYLPEYEIKRMIEEWN